MCVPFLKSKVTSRGFNRQSCYRSVPFKGPSWGRSESLAGHIDPESHSLLQLLRPWGQKARPRSSGQHNCQAGIKVQQESHLQMS